MLLALDETNPSNIIYLTLVFRKISGEFIDENKQITMRLLSKLSTQPLEIFGLLKELVNVQASNDDRRNTLLEKLSGVIAPADAVFNLDNPLFDTAVVQYLTSHPDQLHNF